MPRILYRPNPKRYNAAIAAAAIHIVQRRTRFNGVTMGNLLGVGHTKFHRLKRGYNGMSEMKLNALLLALTEIQREGAKFWHAMNDR